MSGPFRDPPDTGLPDAPPIRIVPGSQVIEARRVDLAAVATEVGVTEIIGHDEQEVRLLAPSFRQSRDRGSRGDNEHQH